MKILGVTLARGGSKGIPRKNIADINGKPLLQYTVDEVKKSKYIDYYIVATDDEEIEDVCLKLDIDTYKRDTVSDTQTSAEGLQEVIGSLNGEKYDYIVEIMCTNPLKTVEDIDGAIESLYNTSADSVVSVVRIWDNHPSRVKYIKDGRLQDFYPEIPESRRQDLTPPAYVRNGSIYAMTYKQITGNKVRLGKDTRPLIMPEERCINIDEPIDLKLAELMLFEKQI